MATAAKSAAIAELTENFRNSGAAVLTEYRGLTVKQLTELRTSMRDHATYAVVKNTLTERAAKEAGVTAFDGQLAGPSAIAFVTGDPVEAAKTLRDFAKANPLLVIKGGDARRQAAHRRRDHASSPTSSPARFSWPSWPAPCRPRSAKAVYLFAAPLSQAARTVDALRAKVEPSPGSRPGRPAAEAVQDEVPPRGGRRSAGRRAGRGRRRRHPAGQLHRRRLSGDVTHHPPLTAPRERNAIMAKLSTDELLEAFKEMTLIELSEFVKQFEETFGVTAAAPVAVAAAGPAAGGGDAAEAAEEEKDEFDVILEPPATRRSRSSRRSAR
jgi:large subunit ribosomal protein L10